MASLENIYKRYTGINPSKDIEPPLSGCRLQKAVKALKRHPKPDPHASLSPPTIDNAWLYDHGREVEEPFTVVIANFSDGSVQAAYLFQPPPEHDIPLVDFAKNSVPPNSWFPFDPEHPSDSGLKSPSTNEPRKS